MASESFSSDPGSPGDKPSRGKPRIWSEGRQRPAFDLRAFLRVATVNSRALAAPALLAIAGGIDRFGIRVEEGEVRIPQNRLGRTGRFLPGHVATGRRLRDSAAMTRLAAEAARGGPAPVQAMPFRSWTDATPAAPAPAAAPPVTAAPGPVQRPARPAPLPKPAEADADRNTLEAIRSLMAMTVVEPQHPARAVKPPPPPPTGVGALPELAPAEPSPRSGLFRLAGRIIGAASVGVAFPLGMAQAGYALAKGDDLRLAP